jgi:DNA-binding Xre family transcriptional regulator
LRLAGVSCQGCRRVAVLLSCGSALAKLNHDIGYLTHICVVIASGRFACLRTYAYTWLTMLDLDKLQKLRDKRGFTQQQAAEAAGMTVARWNDIESGRRANVTIDTLNRIAAALGVKARDLLK